VATIAEETAEIDRAGTEIGVVEIADAKTRIDLLQENAGISAVTCMSNGTYVLGSMCRLNFAFPELLMGEFPGCLPPPSR
jgi:hypothetical protein